MRALCVNGGATSMILVCPAANASHCALPLPQIRLALRSAPAANALHWGLALT